MNTESELRALFREKYSEKNLSASDRKTLRIFLKYTLDSYLIPPEGAEKQRDQAVRYQWGHDHWFADDLDLKGAMKDRHVTMIAALIDKLGMPRDLYDKTVYDVGCWTGGTSLMLAALGATVRAVEEVDAYSDTTQFLAELFECPVNTSFSTGSSGLYSDCLYLGSSYDIVYLCGVIYHLTDPIVALRMLYNALRPGGTIYLESALAMGSTGSFCVYEGPRDTRGGSVKDRNRRGWNWFIPSEECLTRWLEDVGFSKISLRMWTGNRAIVSAKKGQEWVDMCRAGISKEID